MAGSQPAQPDVSPIRPTESESHSSDHDDDGAMPNGLILMFRSLLTSGRVVKQILTRGNGVGH